VKMEKYIINQKNGYIALTTVLILGAIGTLIAVSLLTIGVMRSQTILSVADSINAKAHANACIEDALKEISLSRPYQGTVNINFTNGACTHVVTRLGGQNRRIEATGVSGSSTKYILITIDDLTPMNITSWQEVENF
jgi:hypothetical protein